MELAPIVLFVYNRLPHTVKTIESLQRNELSKDSILYIYSDAPKSKKDIQFVKRVREYIKNIKVFKSVIIIEQEENIGLANSIILGVTDVISKHGKIIVMEDDLVVSEYFLKFMNNSLNYYKYKKDVWHISGWNHPTLLETPKDVFFYRIMNCWGWATWNDRWENFEKNTEALIDRMSSKDIDRFNLDGYTNLWRQVKLNKSGHIDTWAIYWYATIFHHNGLCLNPINSYVQNIGHDGTGEHCSISNYNDNLILNNKPSIGFVAEIKEDIKVVEQIKVYLKKIKKPLLLRAYYKIKTFYIKNKY